jgi:hypothetical protein
MVDSEREKWQGLLAFLPMLRNREPLYWRVGAWGDMPSVVSTETARSFMKCVYDSGLMLDGFDWQAWQEEAIGYLDYRIRLETADLDTVRRLLTAHLRADRFAEGHYDALLENGFFRDLLERAAILLDERRASALSEG